VREKKWREKYLCRDKMEKRKRKRASVRRTESERGEFRKHSNPTAILIYREVKLLL
jgi:hypothetical protein